MLVEIAREGFAVVTVKPVEKRLVDVEDLLFWTYVIQRADAVDNRSLNDGEAAAAGILRLKTSADGVARCERLGLLGRMVDESGPGRNTLPEDAATVHEIVEGMGGYGFRLLQYARRGERPDWGGGLVPKIEPEWKGAPRYGEDGLPEQGAFVVEYRAGDGSGKAGGRTPYLCPIVCEATPYYLESLRCEYAEWWQSLKALAEHFQAGRARLESYIVTGPRAPEYPWLRALDGTPRVLASQPGVDVKQRI